MLRNIEESIQSLMGEFVMESMSDFSTVSPSSFGLKTSDDQNIAHFQLQVGSFILKSKQFLLYDMAAPESMEGQVSAAIKKSVYDGIRSSSFVNNKCMKHLLILTEMTYLSSQVAMLTLHSILKNYDIEEEQQNALRNALDPDSVCIPMGFYVYVICMGNPDYKPTDFNRIFANSWVEYYDSLMTKFLMIRMAGKSWKNQFEDCLFDN